jgi:hypothetical protein
MTDRTTSKARLSWRRLEHTSLIGDVTLCRQPHFSSPWNIVDVLGFSKLDFHAHLLSDEGEAKKSLPTVTGFRQLDAWLRNRQAADV